MRCIILNSHIMKINFLKETGKRLFREIRSLSEKAGESLGRGASGDITYKIDKIAEEIIISALESTGEPLTIISEEIGIKEIKGGGKIVLIDPIDGSRNAVLGIPFYCSSIAIADGDRIGDIEIAYIINLINGDEFYAEKGNGAFINNNILKPQMDDTFYTIAYEAQSPSRDLKTIFPLLSEAKKVRCFGSTALDLVYLAAGSLSVFANPSLSRCIDFAGGWLIVRESGGVFTDIKGESIENIRVGIEKSTSLLVSGNILLHRKALNLINHKKADAALIT